jgi:hypothetical protein
MIYFWSYFVPQIFKMGASTSITSIIGKNNIFISFNKSCDDQLKQNCIDFIIKLNYNIINLDYINDDKLNFIEMDNIKNNILSCQYVIQFISNDTLQSNYQSYIDKIITENNIKLIYLIMDNQLLPLNCRGIRTFIGTNPSYPCFDKSTINYSFNKIKAILSS